MSTSTSARRTSGHASTIVGVVVGVILLGLMAAFAIGLPKTADAEEAEPQVELSLPDTLPGGYTAADLADSFADGELAEQADQIAEQQAESTEYGNEVLPEVLGHPAVTRSYVIDGSKAVFVQVFAAEGGALAPNSLTDPSTTDGGGGLTMENVDGAACVLGYGQSEDGSLGDPTSTQCQLSEGGLTVQTQSNQVGAEALAELSREILAGYDQ
ncbi:hypothetical protein [Nocardioides pyridinolyticus]